MLLKLMGDGCREHVTMKTWKMRHKIPEQREVSICNNHVNCFPYEKKKTKKGRRCRDAALHWSTRVSARVFYLARVRLIM